MVLNLGVYFRLFQVRGTAYAKEKWHDCAKWMCS